MSIKFDSNTDYCRINPAGAVSHYAFTVVAKVRITSAAAGHVLSVCTNTTHVHALKVDSAGTAFTISRNYDTDTAAVATVALDTWHSVAICGWLSGATRKLSGYVKTDAGALQKATVDNPQFGDTLTYVSLGAGSSGDYPRGLLAYAKFYGRALSDAEIEAEMVAEAPVSLTDLISYTTGQGGDITAAMTADTSNAAYADTWTAYDFANAAGTTPTYDADAPTWAAAGPTLSGSVAMTDAAPTAGIAVESFAINSSNNAADVTATFSALPTVGRPLVAFVGGWMGGATDIVLSDNRGIGWVKHGLQKISGSNIWVGCWIGTMLAGSSSELAITATPNVATDNFLTLCVSQITDAYAARLVDVALTFNEGTNTAPTVDLAATTNSKTLLLGAASWVSSLSVASAATNWTMVAKKDGTSGLAVIRRYAATAGNYDPTLALVSSDSWICCGLALTADPPDEVVTSPVVTSIAVSPATANLVVNEAQQFIATVYGEGVYSSAVTWSLEQGGGILSASGLYYAPATATTAVIRATSDVAADVFGNATASVAAVVLPDVDNTGMAISTWTSSGKPLAGAALDYWIISSADALVTYGSGTTDSLGQLIVMVPVQYIGQSVNVVVNNLSQDMATTGKIHSQRVVVVI